MNLQKINQEEKKEIEKKLQEQFGIKNIPGQLIKRGKERIFLFQGDMDWNELQKIERSILIERAGIYFIKEIPGEKKYRLSIEGTQILKDQITKNIFELDKEQAIQWMQGQELNIKTGKRDVLVMKYKEDFLGCGKASAEKIGNFIPKNRRLKTKEI